MLRETELVPFVSSEPIGERILVFAPHPDDETIGMGGSLRILSENGKKIKVTVLTKGEKADPYTKDHQQYAEMRQKEALKAFEVLGVHDYVFLGFPDRELQSNFVKVREESTRIVREFCPDTIYSPSPVELHPDHRVAAEFALTIKEEIPDTRLVFYEITTPIRPNVLVDITKTFRYKKSALKCYKSQLKITDYLKLIEALNTFRTFTLNRKAKTVEAFWEVGLIASKQDLRRWLTYEIPIC